MCFMGKGFFGCEHVQLRLRPTLGDMPRNGNGDQPWRKIGQCVQVSGTHVGTKSGLAQWIEYWPVNRKVAGLIPRQGTCLGCRPGPQLGVCKRQPVSLSQSLPLFLPPFLSQKKKKKRKKNKNTIFKKKKGFAEER